MTVGGDTTSNLNGPTIPFLIRRCIRISRSGGFFFNLDNPAGTSLSFLNAGPSGWTISSTTQNAQGSGGAVFEFRALDPPGNSNNVTNSQSLSFTARLNGGLWTPAMLLNAPLSDGGGIPDPGAQLGAHLQSAVAPCPTQACSDSGFASGSFGGPPTQSVPEPTTLLLMGLGMAGAVRYHRRRS